MTDDDSLVGVSLADALADQLGEARGQLGSDSAVLNDVVWAWFRTNRATLRHLHGSVVTESQFDALLNAATKIGQP